jgi:anti-sigma factor ChrR (cupin superfamily)
MSKRKITDLSSLKFEPFDNYGKAIEGMSWCKISYDKKNGGYGTYVLKMEPGAKSLSHEHKGYEEFLMLDGELTDLDGKIFKKGNFVSFEPGSTHSSFTKDGCLILVFMRGINQPI